MAVAVPSIAVSTNDLISVSNSLESIMILQASDGQLPYAGTPFNELGIVSATYHMYALLGISDYYHYSGDITFLNRYWDQWKRAMNYSLSFVDSSGLMNVTSPNDWLRYGMGGHNIEVRQKLRFTDGSESVLGQLYLIPHPQSWRRASSSSQRFVSYRGMAKHRGWCQTSCQ